MRYCEKETGIDERDGAPCLTLVLQEARSNEVRRLRRRAGYIDIAEAGGAVST